jgi:uncharacterized protein (TIGR02996 family)
MRSVHEIFQRQIAADPDHPLHKQIYADWLEERGDPLCEWWRERAEQSVATLIGNGDGNGDGNGYGYGDGYGNGYGDGYGDGNGYAYGDCNG